eukprot:CAMPEP_0117687950 /NCGR_PEP_ID=MMETSP0804-20121206/23487_1 /TAXON_ID=1074897 /ORGANISM="Tetraselmis astigmatica, Strain CCMP880" /LENGTH=670 /DNA_ID=CAMNT_0005500205 /DNA_START=112 /DNA_END=2124 /DNA_ORIENTATION=+
MPAGQEPDLGGLAEAFAQSVQVGEAAGPADGDGKEPEPALSDTTSGTSSPGLEAYLLGTTHSPVCVWATTALDNIQQGPQKAFWRPDEDGCTQIHLTAARGEKVSFQIGVCRQVPVVGLELSITCSRFDGQSGTAIPPQAATLLRLLPPDALLPYSWGARLTMDSSDTLGFFVAINVPEGQPPGLYTGIITLVGHVSLLPASKAAAKIKDVERLAKQAAREATTVTSLQSTMKTIQGELSKIRKKLDGGSRLLLPETLQVKILVLDVLIPRTPSFPLMCGLDEAVMEKRWQVSRNSPEWQSLFCRHFKFLMKYRFSPYFSRWNARESDMGMVAYSCPFPLDSEDADSLLSSAAVRSFMVPLPIESSEGLPDATAPTVATVKRIMGKRYGDKAIFFLCYEPTSLEHVEKLNQWCKTLREQVPNARVLTAFNSGPKDGELPEGSQESLLQVPELLKDSTNIFCVSEAALGAKSMFSHTLRDQAKAAAGEDAEMWTYIGRVLLPQNTSAPMSPYPNWHLNMSGGQHRAVLWRSWMEGATGMLYWAANSYENHTQDSFQAVQLRKDLPAGDGVLVYPGERYGAGAGNPVASLRLERALMGLQDLEFFEQHAAVFGRDATSSIINVHAYKGPTNFTQEFQEIENLRVAIAQELVSYSQDGLESTASEGLESVASE